MFRRFVKRFGLVRSIIIISIASILFSVAITTILSFVLGGDLTWEDLVISILIPAVLAPFFTWLFLNLIFQIQAAEERMRILSTIDDLTQVFNRRSFFELAEKEHARATRHGESFALVLMDLDNFKQINDHYGHQAGDQVLRQTCDLCRVNSRQEDIFARYGGEEFIFLLPHTGSHEALTFAERIRQVISATPFTFGSESIHLTASLGVKATTGGDENLDSLIACADAALLAAKEQGKERAVLWTAALPGGS